MRDWRRLAAISVWWTGVGRGLALDRDQNWGNVKRVYDALTDGMEARQYGEG